jgi:hypothetical protein
MGVDPCLDIQKESYTTSSINCKDRTKWGSVPRGARKWNPKKEGTLTETVVESVEMKEKPFYS